MEQTSPQPQTNKPETAIALPSKNGVGDLITINLDGKLKSVVIVGANGSGKSRLGAWIEKDQNTKSIFRISAQRAINIPPSIPPISYYDAMNKINYGLTNPDQARNYNEIQLSGSRRVWKWSDQHTTKILDNFKEILSALFAKENERNANYFQMSRDISEKVNPEEHKSAIDKLKIIWNNILPNKALSFRNSVVETYCNSSSYPAGEMSDGERVIIYMIGHCLCLPDNSIIIIDEPENHIHKAILNKLWDLIENERPDCLFVYITQDLDFAASRKNSKKIWVKNYLGKIDPGFETWDWEEIPESDDLPEPLLMEVLGSRKKVIFVEGDKGSLDYLLYSNIYPDFTIIPCGGCSEVIKLTKAFRAKKDLHNQDIYGIIDRDYRSENELNALESDNIFHLKVAEVENLICIPEIINIIADKLVLSQIEAIQKAADHIKERIKSELEFQISTKSANEVKFRLNNFPNDVKNKNDLVNNLNNLVSGIPVEKIYTDNESEFNEILTESDNETLIKKALRLYNRKELYNSLSRQFNLGNSEIRNIIERTISKPERKEAIVKALKTYCPQIN